MNTCLRPGLIIWYHLAKEMGHEVWYVECKVDHQEVGCGDMDWIELAQDRDRWRALVSTVMNLRVP